MKRPVYESAQAAESSVLFTSAPHSSSNFISLLRLIHPHYPPSIPLHLLPTIIVHSSLICPHLLSLDSGVTFPPGHKFCMIVHLQICISKLSLTSP